MKAIVVGGSSGLGFEVAKHLRETGNTVTVLSRRGTAPEGCKGIEFDIDDPKWIDEFEDCDLVYISAGRGAMYGPHQVDGETVDAMLATNLRGPLILGNGMIWMWRHQKRRGTVVFVTSTAGDGPSHGLGLYAACKKGVEGFVRAEGHHAAKYGITLVAHSMGWFESDMTKALKPEVKAAAERHCPKGRFATLAEATRWSCEHLSVQSGVYRFWVER